MRLFRITLAAALLLGLYACPPAAKPPQGNKGALAAASPTPAAAVDPSQMKDQDLFQSALRSKDPKDKVHRLEILFARQQDPEAKEFVRRQLVMAYAEALDVDRMDAEASQITIEDDYNGASLKNAMAYTYAVKGVKLEQAHNLVLSSLSILDRIETTREGVPPQVDPVRFEAFIEENRGYFLDTLGWIDHRSGKDKAALAELMEAARRTDHGTIRYHLAAVQQILGDIDTAGKNYAAAAVEDEEGSLEAKDALEALGKAGKVDAAKLLADAKTAHDARVAKEQAEEKAEEAKRNEELAAAAAAERDAASKGALEMRMEVTTPAFSIADFAGAKLANTDLEHHVTVIDFWASWCGPCKMEMPYMQTLFEKYQGKVRFLAISEDESKDDATGFLQDFLYKDGNGAEKKVTLPAAFDDGSVQRGFQINGLPTLMVIGPCGRINWVHKGFTPNIGAVLTQQLDKLLSEESAKCEAKE